MPSAPSRGATLHRLLVVVALLLTGCSAGSDPAPPQVAAPSPGPSPTARTIEVRVVGGQVTGVEGRVAVQAGEQVVLRVTADVVEELHVHGYDLYADLVAGQTAQLSFTADLAGAWEVELHEAGRPLFQLRVA